MDLWFQWASDKCSIRYPTWTLYLACIWHCGQWEMDTKASSITTSMVFDYSAINPICWSTRYMEMEVYKYNKIQFQFWMESSQRFWASFPVSKHDLVSILQPKDVSMFPQSSKIKAADQRFFEVTEYIWFWWVCPVQHHPGKHSTSVLCMPFFCLFVGTLQIEIRFKWFYNWIFTRWGYSIAI